MVYLVKPRKKQWPTEGVICPSDIDKFGPTPSLQINRGYGRTPRLSTYLSVPLVKYFPILWGSKLACRHYII